MKEADEEEEDELSEDGRASSKEGAMSVDEEPEKVVKKSAKATKTKSASAAKSKPPTKKKKNEPKTRQAVRGLAEPRAMKKVDLEQVSDVGDSDSQGEEEQESGSD